MNALSLLYTVTSKNAPYRPLYETVHDFLETKDKAGKYWVDRARASAFVAERYARILEANGVDGRVE